MNSTAITPPPTPDGLELARRLEHLLRLPLGNPADIEPWDSACSEVQAWLVTHDEELPFELPHHLMHYFHDADIRVKEPGYKERQEQAVRRLVAQLRGEMPLDLPCPWWRGFHLEFKIPTRWRVADGAIILSLVALLAGATVMCSCPGFFVAMAVCAGVALLCGSRLQRLFSAALLLAAVAGFIYEFREEQRVAKRVHLIQERAGQQSR